MRQKITEKTLTRKAPGEIWDEYLPGFGLRIGKAKRTFFVMTRVNGKQRRFTVGNAAITKLVDAREKARDILRDAAKGVAPEEAERAAVRAAARIRARTFRAVAEEYMGDRVDLRSYGEMQRKLDVDVLPVIGDMAVAKIDRADIRELLRDKAATSPVASNRLLSLIRSILRFAYKEDYVQANVADAIDPKPEASRDRVLTHPEIKLFWNTLDNGTGLDPATRHCLKFLLVTGVRRAEATGAKWSEFNFITDQWVIPGDRTKNSYPLIVPLSLLALDLLYDMAELVRGEYVFPGNGDSPVSVHSISQAMKRSLPKMNLPGGRAVPHDLRRTLVTEMNETLGIEPHVVVALVNHVSGAARRGVAGTYNRALYLEQRRLAMEAWGNLLTEIVTGKAAPSNVVDLRGTK